VAFAAAPQAALCSQRFNRLDALRREWSSDTSKARRMESALSSDAAAAICKHMNEDHADAVAAYARTFGKVERVESAELISFDARAMQLGVESGGGRIVTRIPFDHVLADKDDARETLIAMAREAMREP
jgi:putative heme iron utilization protein